MMRVLHLPFILFLGLFTKTSSYGAGAPNSVCGSITPLHGVEKQASPPPYSLKAVAVDGGPRVEVHLSRDESSVIKGFLILAKKSNSDVNTTFGTFHFSNEDAKDYQYVQCPDAAEKAAVTHRSANEKSGVQLEWEAPPGFKGPVTFVATVVHSGAVFWVGLESEQVQITKNIDVSPESSTESSDNTEKQPSLGLAKALNDLYNDCGSLKSCFGLPSGCAAKKNCKTLVTYTKAAGDQYEMELKGHVTDDRYVSVGLSLDQAMGDDSVVLCSVSDGSVDVSTTWNSGRSNVPLVDPKLGLTVLEAGLFEGELYCRFYREKVTEVRNQMFDLENEKYYVMLAEGRMSQDSTPQYHGPNSRIVSESPVNLGQTTNLAARDSRLLKVIHGCLMVAAWVFTSSIGMLLARYYRATWLKYKACSMDQWFHFHRFFMITTWALTLSAFVIIFVELGEFRATKHAWIGLSSVILCFTQPFNAMLRCHPGTKRRPVFNWLHWFIGNAAQTLGITAIFFGFELFLGTDKNWVKEIAWYILVAFIVFQCVTHLTLTVSQCISDYRKAAEDVFPLKELTDNRTPLNSQPVKRDAPLAGFRKFVLAIYIPIVGALCAALIVLLVVKREDIEGQLSEWGSPDIWEREE